MFAHARQLAYQANRPWKRRLMFQIIALVVSPLILIGAAYFIDWFLHA